MVKLIDQSAQQPPNNQGANDGYAGTGGNPYWYYFLPPTGCDIIGFDTYGGASTANPGVDTYTRNDAVTCPSNTAVAAGSNGGIIANIATWTHPSAGVLAVGSTTGFPTAGVLSVATSTTNAQVNYTGKTSNTFTGCTYVQGSAAGTVATSGVVGGLVITDTHCIATDKWASVVFQAGSGAVPTGTQITSVKPGVSFNIQQASASPTPIPATVTGLTIQSQGRVAQPGVRFGTDFPSGGWSTMAWVTGNVLPNLGTTMGGNLVPSVWSISEFGSVGVPTPVPPTPPSFDVASRPDWFTDATTFFNGLTPPPSLVVLYNNASTGNNGGVLYQGTTYHPAQGFWTADGPSQAAWKAIIASGPKPPSNALDALVLTLTGSGTTGGAYWGFEDAVGSATAADLSGNGHTLTLTAVTLGDAGIIPSDNGTAAIFASASSSNAVTAATGSPSTRAGSRSWRPSTGRASSFSAQKILGNGNATGTTGGSIRTTSAGRLACIFGNGTTAVTVGSPFVPVAGDSLLIMATWQNNVAPGTVTLYVYDLTAGTSIVPVTQSLAPASFTPTANFSMGQATLTADLGRVAVLPLAITSNQALAFALAAGYVPLQGEVGQTIEAIG